MPYVAQRQTTVPGGSIDQAAHLAGKSRTDFMLEAACEKAQRLLLDRTVFALDAAGFERRPSSIQPRVHTFSARQIRSSRGV